MTSTAKNYPNDNHASGGHILVVDDDAATRRLLNVILSHHFQVTMVDGGEPALDLIRAQAFDLVLLDISMPGINGFDVLNTLRQDTATAELPVILMSVTANPAAVVDGLEAGANDYIAKPITPSVLMARVKAQLNLKRLTDERKKHIKKLERAERLRTQFTHIASHDLKNPLHNVHIATTLLKEEVEISPRVASILKVLDISVDTMYHVIETFLDVMAIQSNSITLQTEVVPLADVINNVVSQYEITATEKGSHLVMDNIAGYVRVDKARIIQVVSNLVSNALKYSPPGSTITIATEIADGTVRLSVQDEGPGIPEAERSQLFTEFTKLSPVPTANEPRTGLGLWIVKHLMDKQGGTVGASFPDEGGSIFWLELPVASESQMLVGESA